MLKLLIIKDGDDYIRVRNNDGNISFESCIFDKASVFPVSKIETVKEHIKTLSSQGKLAVIRQLIIEEQSYSED